MDFEIEALAGILSLVIHSVNGRYVIFSENRFPADKVDINFGNNHGQKDLI